jgi:hypothetical protein
MVVENASPAFAEVSIAAVVSRTSGGAKFTVTGVVTDRGGALESVTVTLNVNVPLEYGRAVKLPVAASIDISGPGQPNPLIVHVYGALPPAAVGVWLRLFGHTVTDGTPAVDIVSAGVSTTVTVRVSVCDRPNWSVAVTVNVTEPSCSDADWVAEN